MKLRAEHIANAPRKWRTSPPFPGLVERLPTGAKMEDAEFPVVCETGA